MENEEWGIENWEWEMVKGKWGMRNGKLKSGDIVVNVELNCISGYCHNILETLFSNGRSDLPFSLFLYLSN